MKPVVLSAIFGIIVSFLSCCLIYWGTHNYKMVLLVAACNALLTYQMVYDVKKIYEEDTPKQLRKALIRSADKVGCTTKKEIEDWIEENT